MEKPVLVCDDVPEVGVALGVVLDVVDVDAWAAAVETSAKPPPITGVIAN